MRRITYGWDRRTTTRRSAVGGNVSSPVLCDLQDDKTDETFCIDENHKGPEVSQLPCRIWLFPNGTDKPICQSLWVRTKCSMKLLYDLITKECPLVVNGLGLRVTGLYHSKTRAKVQSVTELVKESKYLVTGAYRPDWQTAKSNMKLFK